MESDRVSIADAKIAEIKSYFETNGFVLKEEEPKTVSHEMQSLISIIIKKDGEKIAHILYTDYNVAPSSITRNMSYTEPVIDIEQVTVFNPASEFKGIGKKLIQYVAALAVKAGKPLTFRAVASSDPDKNFVKLIKYYNSLGANRFDMPGLPKIDPLRPAHAIGIRMLGPRGILYKTNDPLKIIQSAGKRTMTKRSTTKQTRRARRRQ